MLRITLSLVAGLVLLGAVSCVKCPDGKECTGLETCCQSKKGYNCCPYPDAVCCSDMLHCCPSGYNCNFATHMCEKQKLPWFKILIVMKEAEKSSVRVLPAFAPQELENNQVPVETKSPAVFCDNIFQCPPGTTCCRSQGLVWFCCRYSPGTCCLDGYHCCPMGYQCDSTFTFCQKQSLRYPFTARKQWSVIPAALIVASEERSGLPEKPLTPLIEISNNVQEPGDVKVKCDSMFSCPEDMTCCKGPEGKWTCCPYRMGQCCADGLHCCEYGSTCSSSSLSCKKSSSL